jgi:hypothetical protein
VSLEEEEKPSIKDLGTKEPISSGKISGRG